MREKHIAKITDMLLSGGKMLSIHCGECKSPLFEYQGKVVCPVCGEREVKAPPEPALKPAAVGTERVLREKLDWVTGQLQRETDHRKISELVELMKSLLEALEKVKR
jgi:uncharacterized Zn finger protein (UPF0148 family)